MIEVLTKCNKTKSKQVKDSVTKEVIGMKVFATDFYNIADGQVVYIGKENGEFVINVKSSDSEMLRYGPLTKLNVYNGQNVKQGDHLGSTEHYCKVEYLTAWRGNSSCPVRVNQSTYYKQDPTDIIDGTYTVVPSKELQLGAGDVKRGAEYTPAQKEEFTGGKW